MISAIIVLNIDPCRVAVAGDVAPNLPPFITGLCSRCEHAPDLGPGCELVWGEATEARVRSAAVVIDPPFFDQPASRRNLAQEQRRTRYLGNAILRGLARRCLTARWK